MAYRTFIVTHAHARSPIIVKGKTLNEALKKEGLDPAIWKDTGAKPESEDPDHGDNQGDGREEDN